MNNKKYNNYLQNMIHQYDRLSDDLWIELQTSAYEPCFNYFTFASLLPKDCELNTISAASHYFLINDNTYVIMYFKPQGFSWEFISFNEFFNACSISEQKHMLMHLDFYAKNYGLIDIAGRNYERNDNYPVKNFIADNFGSFVAEIQDFIIWNFIDIKDS